MVYRQTVCTPSGLESPKLPLNTKIHKYAIEITDKTTEITSVYVRVYVN
jgi:hypothetical protein